MTLRTLLLVLSTTALPTLTGCATTSGGTRETPATSSSSLQEQDHGSPGVDAQDKKDKKDGCGCSHGAMGEGVQSASASAACSCPHCASMARGTQVASADCACGHGKSGDDGPTQFPRGDE
ncbi:MAG: hypothetical protein L0Y66_10945 [Myxococcaceae bacterium]|nr:hypothetical protein [Myxococcaceae bacterium]MCI0670084.1 hypothetical protein [Myxococcaceae bacterium]